jgi:hypothetical protein
MFVTNYLDTMSFKILFLGLVIILPGKFSEHSGRNDKCNVYGWVLG